MAAGAAVHPAGIVVGGAVVAAGAGGAAAAGSGDAGGGCVGAEDDPVDEERRAGADQQLLLARRQGDRAGPAGMGRNRISVEEDKPQHERGFYLHPDALDQSAEKSILRVQQPR